jgi:hypothetical protein
VSGLNVKAEHIIATGKIVPLIMVLLFMLFN